MKDQIKIRKRWLIDPSTKVEPSKKIKQRFQEEKDDFREYLGEFTREELEKIEEEDLEEEDLEEKQ